MKKILIKIILFFIFFILSISILEIFIRFAEIELPRPVFIKNELKVLKNPPNKKIIHFAEGFSLDRSNKYGMIGPDYGPERNPKTLRIALIGNSLIKGSDLFERHRIRTLLEKELNKYLTKKVEVLNFGIPLLDFRRMYIEYKYHVQEFNPDISLFFIRNKDLLQSWDKAFPDCYLANDSLMLDYSFTESSYYRFHENFNKYSSKSSILNLVQNAYIINKNNKTKEILFGKLSKYIKHPDIYYNKIIKKFTNDKTTKKNNSIKNEQNLLELNTQIFKEINDTSIYHSKVILVVVDKLPQEYINELSEKNIEIIELHSLLEGLMKKGDNPYYWKTVNKQGHWNHLAHKEISSYLSIELIKRLSFTDK